jgi:hypothetical protein
MITINPCQALCPHHIWQEQQPRRTWGRVHVLRWAELYSRTYLIHAKACCRPGRLICIACLLDLSWAAMFKRANGSYMQTRTCRSKQLWRHGGIPLKRHVHQVNPLAIQPGCVISPTYSVAHMSHLLIIPAAWLQPTTLGSST